MRRNLPLLLVVLLLASTFTVPGANAQNRRASRRAKAKPPAAVQREPAPEYRSGEVVIPINVSASSIRLGLSQHGVAVIEFPANDPFYAHHPGDEDFVTIDKRSKKPSIDPLVIRPGKGFVVQKGRPRPSTVITVQTSSGLVIPFLIYPVESAAQNANHVVVTYDRDAVVAARRREGLRTDLVPRAQLAKLLTGDDAPGEAAQPAPTTATLVDATPARSAAAVVPTPSPTPAPAFVQPASVEVASTTPVSNFAARSFAPANSVEAAAVPTPTPSPVAVAAPPINFQPKTAPVSSAPVAAPDAAEMERATRDELARVAGAPQKLRFASPVYGLSLAVNRSRFVLAGYRIEVVAVRNTLTEPVRLVPGMPEVYVETLNNKLPIDSNRLPQRFLASTLPEGTMLAPGGTYYFAFAFDEPILGASEVLRVAVAQTNAADAPATANLITAAR